MAKVECTNCGYMMEKSGGGGGNQRTCPECGNVQIA